MKATIELNDDVLDGLVVLSLKDSYRMNLSPGTIDNASELIDPDDELLRAIDMVLDYYLSYEQKIEWGKQKAEWRSASTGS